MLMVGGPNDLDMEQLHVLDGITFPITTADSNFGTTSASGIKMWKGHFFQSQLIDELHCILEAKDLATVLF